MNDENLTKLLVRIEREPVIISTGLRLLVDKKIKQILKEELDIDQKWQVYELTEGARSRREIARIASVSDDIIQGWWGRWVFNSLLREDPRTGRSYKSLSLQELGLKLGNKTLRRDS